MKNEIRENEQEKIDLMRSGTITSSLAGAFGKSLRETRITAMLGYLIALEPKAFCEYFKFAGTPIQVSLETVHEYDRSDILVKTSEGLGIVEAKVKPVDPMHQALKYPARWRVLLTDHFPLSAKTGNRYKYVLWKELRQFISRFEKSKNADSRFISRDISAYLEEHKMVQAKDSVEVYAREINNEKTLNLFLRGRLYGCLYEKGSRLPRAQYFAPHFGQSIAQNHPGVQVGISYVARIESIEIVKSWRELIGVIKTERGKTWLNSHNAHISPIRLGWEWKSIQRSFLFLGTPRLVFNPPVIKENLQGGKGFLSKRFHSFDELFEAWGC